jgi:NhaA family Na+:H+ antiporter
MWYCLLLAGVSGIMAGVAVAALAPYARRTYARGRLQLPEKIEDILLPIAAYVVVPLFVFTSGGLVFGSVSFGDGKSRMVLAGVAAGLLLGKPLGIIGACILGTKLRIASLPQGVAWRHIIGTAFVAGAGFTVSILVANLSFDQHPQYRQAALLGIFIATVLASLAGLLILRSARKPVKRTLTV